MRVHGDLRGVRVEKADDGASVLIGLTLAVDPDFKTLFVVIIFHRECFSFFCLLFYFLRLLIDPRLETFEGLGVGTRLAYMQLPPSYNWVPVLGAMLYGLTTPIGTPNPRVFA